MERIERSMRRAAGALWPEAMGALIVAGLGACDDDGSPLEVEDGGSVTRPDGAGNEVSVILTNVPASNGVVHVVDSVPLPE